MEGITGNRSAAARDPRLPADQGAAALRPRGPGADQRGSGSRLSDPRRHPDHAGRRGATVARRRDADASAPATPEEAPVNAGGTTRWPVELRLKQAEKLLEIAFDDGSRFRLPAEYLRVESPSAEVQGHGPGQKTLVARPRACRDHRAGAGRQLRGAHHLRRFARHRDLLLGLSPSARRRAREALARISRRPGGERAQPRAGRDSRVVRASRAIPLLFPCYWIKFPCSAI